MLNWSEREKKAFYIEAKNLCEINWKKNSGTSVDSEKLAKEYIVEGVKRFISEKYSFGCMVGYVLKGHPDGTVKKINKYVEPHCCVGKIECRHTIHDHKYFYSSKNLRDDKRIILKHIFFPFSDN